MDSKVAQASVSVIIAAHNVETYIGRAVHSALDQRGVNVEVIVIDDGSTDGTWAAVSKINDPRLKRIRLPKNNGPSAARNVGLASATKPWIAILDGDDALQPDRLARCLKLAEQTGADIVVDNLTVCREADGAIYPMFAPRRYAKLDFLDLARFIRGNQDFLGGGEAYGYLKPVFSAPFLRTNNLSYDPEIRIGEDYMLMAEALACKAKCFVEPAQGYLYTARVGSTSHRLSLNDIKRIEDGDRKFLLRYTLDPAAARAQKQRTAKLQVARNFTLLVNAIKQRDFVATIDLFIHHPFVFCYLWRPLWARVSKRL